MNFVDSVVSFALMPLSLSVVFVQECLSALQDMLGLNAREMEGKVVLITGASSGIGESLAHVFYDAGCRVILVARRLTELDRVKNELMRKKTNGTVYVPVVIQMDVGELDSIEEKVDEIFKIYERVDVLINNAGLTHRGSVLETKLDVDKHLMNVNYFGTIALTKAIVPKMIENRWGRVVFMSSIQGKIAIPHRSAYTASKHALQAFSDSLRAELCDSNVTVTTISPGYVSTNLSLNALTGSGEAHGKMDEANQKGYSPDYIALETFKAVMKGKKDLVLSPLIPRLAIFLRYLFPSVYFLIMSYRARKGLKDKSS